MSKLTLPENCAKQWEILMLLISSEEKKIDRKNETEIDTMNYFIKNEGIRRILDEWLHEMTESYSRKTSKTDTALKCDEVSLAWRQEGNDKFRANLYEDSYKCYTRSVIYAQKGGPMYPLALANRSATLLKMKQFEDCKSDITLALAQGYPSEQRHKLLLRRADCHLELGAIDLAKEAINEAIKHASTLKLTTGQSLEFENNVKILNQKMEAMKGEPRRDEDTLPECLNGTNDNFVSASSVVELHRNEAAGRHVIVKEPTRRGDVMFSEEPYAWVPLPHETLPYETLICDGCCRVQINAIPCDTCSRTLYCSEECRIRCADTYHKWECVGASSKLFPTIGIAHLALRVLLVAAQNGFPEIPGREPGLVAAATLFANYGEVDNIDIYKKDTPSFFRMFNLVTNFEKMNNTDYIQYALTATMLTLYLEKFTSFFSYMALQVPYTMTRGQLRLFAAGILLRSLGQLVCNGHATLGLCTFDDGHMATATVAEREVRRATAIYPSAAMMNHSCDPNIITSFYNNRLIVRCSRELAPGDELVNCYGPHRNREPTQDRRAQLRAQYLFTCNCPSCMDPERGDFVLLFSAYTCTNCKGPVLKNSRKLQCQQCHTDFQVEPALAAIDRANEMLAEANNARTMEERCEKAQASYRLKQQIWHRHHVSLRYAADRLARAYADAGDFNKSVELIKQNVQSLEYQYGSFSVEVSHELRKLSDVMLERIIRTPENPDFRDWCLESLKIIKKAIQLMELNYGSWEALVKHLHEQEALVAALVADGQSADRSDNVHCNLFYNLKI